MDAVDHGPPGVGGDVFDAHLDGTLSAVLEKEVARKLARELAGLTAREAAVLGLLSRRLAEERRTARP